MNIVEHIYIHVLLSLNNFCVKWEHEGNSQSDLNKRSRLIASYIIKHFIVHLKFSYCIFMLKHNYKLLVALVGKLGTKIY